MRIRFLRDWTTFKPGDIVDLSVHTARRLIAINYAIVCEGKAIDEPVKDKMVKKAKGKKSKKERKTDNTSEPGKGEK